ncbi:aminotransferase class III-fold pyridoxal phosphate-dependent enzyme [Paucibacter sp. APW11]|uniref:Adenosylmethionine-8-amino-7-oxononanoate aminotransferase n=1 Tax=Roseateles aquae TaxID=3077235 RepID=A0ABU3PDU7_9BURK|nr:aminotransferase class III-fold pyridoxal phosphate-dependent enzyme [Paucibacter sp. APW11]MDT9000729.1 aminotransferase class III-fold pyridoxal phosphate-dependent enzyme [Paucibacter sp. APW11]
MTSPSNQTQALQRRSLDAVWHPCTQMARAEAVPPLPIARGEGPWLYDFEGQRYFDANSSWWVNLFGHADAAINAAIKHQLDTLPHVMLAGCTHEPAVRLAERLSARTGGALGHVFFGSDGASAVEIALKQSFHSWRNLGRSDKREFVCLQNGYHGETIGALAVTDVAIFRDAYDPLLMRAHIVTSPDSRLGNEAEALAAMRALLAERHDQIAAVIVEPLVQGAAGMVMHSPNYLRQLRAMTREFGVHLIADEIAVGCGRTGQFFAWEHVSPRPTGTPSAPRGGAAAFGSGPAGDRDTQPPQGQDWPDFILLSKGITAGTLPLSLVLTTDAVYRAFWSDDVKRGFLHSHSYTGNALACAAANAVLDRFDAGQIERNAEQASLLMEAFAPLGQCSRVEQLRQQGMILAFDVVDAPSGFAEAFHLAARRHQLLIRPIGRTVYLMPPYLIDAATAAWLAAAVRATLCDLFPDVA